MRRTSGLVAIAAAALAACGLFPSAADSPTSGTLISDYRIVQFGGGSLHVALVRQRVVAEWITNEYGVPFTVDVERTTENLDPDVPLPATVVVPAHATVRLGAWQIENPALRWSEHSSLLGQPGDPATRPAPYAYALPFTAGEPHRVIQGYGGAFSHTADDEFAVDFQMPEGTTVRAARDGIVVAMNDRATGHGTTPAWKDMANANWLLVLHADGTLGEYWHLAPHGMLVAVGQHVARGDAIARSGFTGYASGPHLHFAVRTAQSGAHARSFPFTLRTSATTDEAPVEGKIYTAFE